MNQINIVIINKKGQFQQIRNVNKIETTWREKGHAIITISYYLFGDLYTYVADYVLRAFNNADKYFVTQYIVTLTVGDRTSNYILVYDYEYADYVWDIDWYEGESEVIIHGAIDLDNIFISGIIGEVNE